MTVNVAIKKNTERIWTLAWVRYVNIKLNADYEIEPEYDELTMVDMHAVSKSGKFSKLDMQLTFAIEMPFIAYESAEIDWTKKPTLEAIDRKLTKCETRGMDCKFLILIIQGYMNKKQVKIAFADPEFKKYAHYPFRGIYYVSPPMISGDTKENLQGGTVYAIKKAFGKY